MDEWTAFVTARLDEKEKRAGHVHDVKRDMEPFGGTGRCVCGCPSRALREVEALRSILAEHHPADWTAYGEHMCSRCACGDDEPHDELHHWMPWPCPTARATASIWSDHPDYPGAGQ